MTSEPVIPERMPLPEGAPPSPRPWGFWATLGLAVAVMAVQFFISAAVAVVFVVVVLATRPRAGAEDIVKHLASNGLYLMLAFLASAPVCSALVLLFAWLRRRQCPLREYLGLRFPPAWQAAVWVLSALVLLGAAEAINYLVRGPVTGKFMVETYRTSVFPLLLAFTFVLAAPLFEELLFRGFVLEGIRRSLAGPEAAILISSALWSLLHLQYGWDGILLVFLFGILLGAARLRTGSVGVCFLMHAAYNLVCMVQTAVKAGNPV